MANDSDLFLFGDDLDAVLEALEVEESIDEFFEEAVAEVSQKMLCLYKNLCKNVMFVDRRVRSMLSSLSSTKLNYNPY